MFKTIISLCVLFTVICFAGASSVVNTSPGTVHRIESNEAFQTVTTLPNVMFLVEHPTSRMSKRVIDEIKEWAPKCNSDKLAIFSADPSIVTDFRDFLDKNLVRMEVISYGTPKQFVYSGSGSVVFMRAGQYAGIEHGLLITMQNRIESVLKQKLPGLVGAGESFCAVPPPLHSDTMGASSIEVSPVEAKAEL